MSCRASSSLSTRSRAGLVALLALGVGCTSRGTVPRQQTLTSAGFDTSLKDVSPYTADSATVVVQRNCRPPLQAAMVRNATGWVVSWAEINAHVATLPIEPHGENNHLLLPQVPGAPPVHASIASIVGTETLTEDQSLRAMLCGRVIARIISDGDHPPTNILKGANYLILAREQPPLDPNKKWIFIIVNTDQQRRASLPRFTYTPHYATNNAPWFSTKVYAFRQALRERPISPKAQDCLARGFKACFIDATQAETHDEHGGLFLGLASFPAGVFQTEISEAWVSCPLYGCCCDGTGCHGS
jgi:hypothetical protein